MITLNEHEKHLIEVLKALYNNIDYKLTIKQLNKTIDSIKLLKYNFESYVDNINILIWLTENTHIVFDGYPEDIIYSIDIESGDFKTEFNLGNYIESQLI